MGKLYFYYGTMNSSKSASLLMNVYNYKSQGKGVLLLKPSFDTRNPNGEISSRVGISHKAYEFTDDTDLYRLIWQYMTDTHVDAVFVDEIHFSTKEQIKELAQVVDNLDVNVVCYGLKNSYIDGVVFDSIQELLYQCNNMYEIKSCCEWCNSKSTHHLRIVNGIAVRSGEQNIVGDIASDDIERYISCCRYHYYNPKI